MQNQANSSEPAVSEQKSFPLRPAQASSSKSTSRGQDQTKSEAKARIPLKDAASKAWFDAASKKWASGFSEAEKLEDFIDGRKCVVHTSFSPYAEHPTVDWLDTFRVACTVGGKDVGHAAAQYIERSKVPSDFRKAMIEQGPRASTMAEQLFDRFGRLAKNLKEHPYIKGSGVWGSELDSGDILFIDHFCINEKWRGKGVEEVILKYLRLVGQSGQKLMNRRPGYQKFVEGVGLMLIGTVGLRTRSPTPRVLSFEIIDPGLLPDHDHEEPNFQLNSEEAEQARRQAIMRILGYRRIGSSSFFGFASDDAHPSHSLAASHDFDAVEPPTFEQEGHLTKEDDPLNLQREKRLYPLHHAIISLPDVSCLEMLRRSNDLGKINDHGENLLHLAAMNLKERCIEFLLQKAEKNHHLTMGRTRDGYTPLELVLHQIEGARDRDEVGCGKGTPQDRFTGASERTTRALIAFHGGSLSEEKLQQLKYGCTCGECLDGFLSPRMCVALQSEAELVQNTLSSGIEDGLNWVTKHDCLLKHVSTDLLEKLRADRPLRMGVVAMFEHVSSCINKKTPPTLESLRGYALKSPASKKFIKRGGTIDSALRLVFELANKADKFAGTGEGWKRYGEQVEQLKECRNDSEFAFAALVSGVSDLGCTCVLHGGRK